MTYFELLNKVLLELGLNVLDKFENAYKNEHFRALEALKTANENICRVFEWDFLRKKHEKTLKAGSDRQYIADFEKIFSVKIGGKNLQFDKNYLKNGFRLSGSNFWGACADGIVEFSPVKKETDIEIIYKSKHFAIGEDGVSKRNFAEKNDTSVLPDIANNALVYGACMLIKPPTAPKYAVWEAEQKKSMRNLIVASAIADEQNPRIRLSKQLFGLD